MDLIKINSIALKFKGVLLSNRIFFAAIALSFGVHLVWLSLIGVAAPEWKGPVKFSKVSFLGPAFGGGVIEASPDRRELSFLERRYMANASLAGRPSHEPINGEVEPQVGLAGGYGDYFKSLSRKAIGSWRLSPRI